MRLTLRARKRLLSTAAVMCLLAAPLVLTWAFWPLDMTVSDPSATTSATGELPTASLLSHNVAEVEESLWTKRLRRPLYDPPPPEPVKVTPPPLRIALLGTILEPGNSMAIISAPDGAVQYKRVGDQVGPAESPAQLVEIQNGAILVRRDDETITLRQSGEE